jgi:hypothetical protein
MPGALVKEKEKMHSAQNEIPSPALKNSLQQL